MAKTNWTDLAKAHYGSQWDWESYSKGVLGAVDAYKQSKSWYGVSKEDNPFSKGNIGSTIKTGIGALSDPIGAPMGKYKRGLYDVADPLYHLAGNNKTVVGEGLSEAGVGLFKAGAQSGNGFLMLAGGIAKGLGSGINALWGTGVDEKKLNEANEETDYLNNFRSNATSFTEIPTVRAVRNIEDPYTSGLFMGDWADTRNKALRTNRKVGLESAYASIENNIKNLKEEQMVNAIRNTFSLGGFLDTRRNKNFKQNIILAYRPIDNNVPNIMRNQMDVDLANYTVLGEPLDTVDPSTAIGYLLYTDKFIEKNNKNNTENILNMFAGTPNNMFAFGGNTLTNGANWSDGTIHVNAGGQHELNTYGGVLMGIDNQGAPNLTELDELVYNDYVFSNRLTVPKLNISKKKDSKPTLELKVLKRFEGMTYADAAKKAEKESGANERPNDDIAKRGLEFTLEVLARSQEQERELEKLKEMLETINNMTPEEFAMMLQQQEQQAVEQAVQDAAAQLLVQSLELQLLSPEEIALMQLQNMQQQEQLPVMANGGILNTPDNMYPYGGSLADFEKELSKYGKTLRDYYIASQLDPSTGYTEDFLGREFDTNGDVLLTEANFNKDIAQLYLESLRNLSNPEVLALNYYNNKYDKKLSFDEWQQLSSDTRNKYIRLYKHSLKNKKDKDSFQKSLDLYNNGVKAIEEINRYQEGIRNSKLTEKDIAKLDDSLKERLANWLGVQVPDSSILSNTEYKTAKSKFDKDIAEAASNQNKTIGEINNLFTLPAMHNDWKPIDINSTAGYTLKDNIQDAYNDALNVAEENIPLYKTIYGDDFQNHLKTPEAFKTYLQEDVDGKPRYMTLLEGADASIRPNALYAERNLYHVNGEDGDRYYAPIDTSNINNFYSDAITTNEGTNIHELTPNAPIYINRVEDIPLTVKVNEDGTYSYIGDSEGTTRSEDGTDNNGLPKAPTWPYKVAAGLLIGTLLHNILSPKNYDNADAIIAGAHNAGTYQPVGFKPVGNYLTYTPMDIWYELNRLNANARATDRAILNNASPIGTKNAALLANAYNNQLASGNLYRLALEYNDALKKQVEEFNRASNMFNSEGFFKADAANQQAGITARAHELEGLKSGYAMRLAVDDARQSAINAGLTGLANLGIQYALNKYGQDVINWLLANNIYPIGGAAYGGKLRKRRKGLI